MDSRVTEYPWHVSILIPACNEEELIGRCVRSVLKACASLPELVTSDIVVLADNCTDRTAAIAVALLKSRGIVRKANVRSAGTARALAATYAMKRKQAPLYRWWIANTDADCAIPEDWLVEQLRLASGGAEAIAGTVSVDSFAEHGPQVPDRFRASYTIEADGSHPHIHGANLGVRADAYLRAGGWADLCTAEDHDLWGRLKRTMCRTISTATVNVVTSGRRVGRAPRGFADALASHNQTAHNANSHEQTAA